MNWINKKWPNEYVDLQTMGTQGGRWETELKELRKKIGN